jgi:hypothetical protein
VERPRLAATIQRRINFKFEELKSYKSVRVHRMALRTVGLHIVAAFDPSEPSSDVVRVIVDKTALIRCSRNSYTIIPLVRHKMTRSGLADLAGACCRNTYIRYSRFRIPSR